MNELLELLPPSTLAQICADIREATLEGAQLTDKQKAEAVALYQQGVSLIGKEQFEKLVNDME